MTASPRRACTQNTRAARLLPQTLHMCFSLFFFLAFPPENSESQSCDNRTLRSSPRPPFPPLASASTLFSRSRRKDGNRYLLSSSVKSLTPFPPQTPIRSPLLPFITSRLQNETFFFFLLFGFPRRAGPSLASPLLVRGTFSRMRKPTSYSA